MSRFLMSFPQPKQIELHFTVGESLVCASLGAASDEGRDIWLVKAEDYKVGQHSFQVVNKNVLSVRSILKPYNNKYQKKTY